MNQTASRQSVLIRREWDVFPISGNGLRHHEAEAFLRSAERAAKDLRRGQGAVLNRIAGGLKAGQVCGVLSRQGRSLEILPKIDGTGSESRLALIRMLSVVNDLRISDGELAHLQTQRRDLLELLVMLFARKLAKAMKGGLQRQYKRHVDDLPYVRGTINIGQQLAKRPVAPTKLFCEFDELSENTPLNRLLKAVVLRLLGISRSSETQRRLQIILDVFRDVGRSRNPFAEPIQFDRSAAAFADIIPLARLLLGGHWQNTTSGDTTGTALLFPMNDLFERYVARRARQTLGSGVYIQHAQHHALSDKLFRMIPDIVIDYKGEPVIIDTKWKRLNPADKKRLAVAQSDIYQMMAYGHRYATCESRPRLVLLYPHHEALREPEGVLRQWTVKGSGLPLAIATVDISKRRAPEQWRDLFEQIGPRPTPAQPTGEMPGVGHS
ncbi:MAG: McrC family protein [Roseovarius sp.]|nr:McrC family protein [Roseovarius sp.]